MARQVTIIFNEDGRLWAEYLQKRLLSSESMSVNVFLVTDKAIFSDTLDTRSQTYILHSSAVLVIVTPEHMDYMLSKPAASYEKLVPNVDRGMLFLVGITEEKINEKDVRKQTREIFPNYAAWTKVNYVDKKSIDVLMEKLVEIMERPECVQSSFTLIPRILHCEEETTVVAMIDEPIPENADVKAVVTGSYFDAVLRCQRSNPYTYSFVMPKHLEDEVTVIIKVNKQSLGSQAKLTYKSYISCSDQTAISEIYCYMLDQLCSYVKTKMNNSNVKNDIDEKLSAVFDHLVDLPAVGYEKLFGIYQNLNEECSRSKLPTLVHLGAMHNLTELVARLQDLPFFANTLSIHNNEHKTPKQIAQSLSYTTLAEYLEDFEEQVDQYAAMMYGDHAANYYNKGDILNMQKPDTMPTDLPAYADMTGRNSSAQLQSEEFYMDMEIGEKQEEVQNAFTKWQRKYQNDSSNTFESKQAALKKTKEELSKVITTTGRQGEDNKSSLKSFAGVKYGGREAIPPPVPQRMPTKKGIQVANQAGSGMYLDLPERSISDETGEEYDYADMDPLLRGTSKRQGTSHHNSTRSSGSSSGRGSTSSTAEESSLTKRFSSTALDLPEPPPVPRKKEETTKQHRIGRFH